MVIPETLWDGRGPPALSDNSSGMTRPPVHQDSRPATEGPPVRYDAVIISLHWLLALLITVSFGLGVYMTDLAVSPTRLRLYNWHKWAGVTILALSALRLVWRRGHPPPELPAPLAASMPRWQHTMLHAMHRAMYVLFFAVPLAGWAYSSAEGFPVSWFGVLQLPDFVPVNHDLAEALYKPLHAGCAFALAALVALHVLAVLKHQWIDGAELLARMWPARRKDAP